MSHPLLHALANRKYLRKVEENLRAGHSVFIEGPRHYGKEHAVRSLAATLREKDGWRVVELSSRPEQVGLALDTTSLSKSILNQIGKPQAKREQPLEEVAMEELIQADHRTLVILRGGGRGNETNHFTLVTTFDHLLQRAYVLGLHQLVVIAIDDGSIFQRTESFNSPTEPFSFLRPAIRFGPLSRADIVDCVRMLPLDFVPIDGTEENYLIDWIAENTGGHPGLIAELLAVWPKERTASGWQDYRCLFVEVLEQSAVLNALSRSIQQDPEGLSRTALEYVEPQFPDAHNSRVNLLTQLGIVHWTSLSEKLHLCPGAITRIVRSAAARSKELTPHVGTIVSEMGPRVFLDKEVPLDDDTIVVVQLSDLHIGPDYRHAIRQQRSAHNLEERSLAELLQEDIDKMQLAGRVDGLILSGDFVSNAAEWEQFQRAKETVEELFSVLGVGHRQTLMVPGNHDVNWKPGPHTESVNSQNTSMDFYRDFASQLLKKREPDALRIVSRSKKVFLDLIGLDSNHVEGPESGGIGYVSQDSYGKAQKQLSRLLKPTPNGSKKKIEAVRRHLWVIAHHHLLPITDFTQAASKLRKVSVMANASQLISTVNRWGAEMVLHGHAHQPAVTVTRRWPTGNEQEFTTLPIISCGSVGAKVDQLGPFARNQYFVIYRRRNDIIVRSRWMDEQGVCFTSHKDVSLPQPSLAVGN